MKINEKPSYDLLMVSTNFSDIFSTNEPIFDSQLKINSKNNHGFEIKIKLNGFVSKQTVVGAIKKFIRSVPASNHGIKMFAIVLMAHGKENDWYVMIGVNKLINFR